VDDYWRMMLQQCSLALLSFDKLELGNPRCHKLEMKNVVRGL
jgi:hypothetical protein